MTKRNKQSGSLPFAIGRSIFISDPTYDHPVPSKKACHKRRPIDTSYPLQVLRLKQSFDVERLDARDMDFYYRVSSELRQLAQRLGYEIAIRTVAHFPEVSRSSYSARVIRVWRVR